MASQAMWRLLDTLLEERFHITTGFHNGQRDIIELLIQGKRLLAIQHTGWGKSLCYQLTSLLHPHLTIVFSPLKALMRDQWQRCNSTYDIPSAIISSDFTIEENRATLAKAVAGAIQILFIAPERLGDFDWQASVLQMQISMIVIDEAHCISVWGHDFRPYYRRIVRLLDVLPKSTSVLALTATANKDVEEDILRQLGDAQVIRGNLQRNNLYVNVERLHGDWEKLCYLAEVLQHRSDTGIIYTATQSSAEMIAMFLKLRGIKAEYYHAGREDSVRQDIEQKLMTNQYNVICSTTALGMGIDKQDIRFVVHYHLPASPIHYYQEIGRAGRDGHIAWCVLLYDPTDMSIQEHLIHNDKPLEKSYETVLSLLRTESRRLNEHDIMLKTGLSHNIVRTVLADLEDHSLISFNPKAHTYTSYVEDTSGDSHIDLQTIFSISQSVQVQKLQALQALYYYAQGERCYMEYLVKYLGDHINYRCGYCGHCRKENFPPVKPSERIQASVVYFLEEEYLPCIEEHAIGDIRVHEAGWALSYHGRSRIGRLVAASKYESGGPFALSLVLRTTEVIRAHYPIQYLNGIVSVPPTQGTMLVEIFARQISNLLYLEYLPVLIKARSTRKQKSLTNRVQKFDNVKNAFSVSDTGRIAGRTLLLIDDIYDSGYTLREVGKVLMQAGATVVYPFTITRTTHSDNQ